MRGLVQPSSMSAAAGLGGISLAVMAVARLAVPMRGVVGGEEAEELSPEGGEGGGGGSGCEVRQPWLVVLMLVLSWTDASCPDGPRRGAVIL